jgi:two-component system phosphate regulon sensor histidine kinase PhoR
MLTAKIFLKLIVGVAGVLLIGVVVMDRLVSPLARATLLEERTRELEQKARMLAGLAPEGLGNISPEGLRALARQAGVRLTVIASDGAVLADTEADPARMENHAARPEVAAALNGRAGSVQRFSPTVRTQSLYVAIPIPAGALRLAVPLADVERRVAVLRREMLRSVMLAFLPVMLIAAIFARYVSSKLGAIISFAGELADGGFRRRLNWRGQNELAQLARKLDETAAKLESTFDQLHREHAELEKLEQVRKDFVINISHELRTPLASILGYAETLLNGAMREPENNVRFLEIIRQNAERLSNLTKDLLTLSRIELKLQRFQFASYLVNQLIKDCVDSLGPLAAAKDLTIAITPAPPETEIFCDAEAVHQALSNLLDNAIKYTPPGGHIEVSARPLPAAPGQPRFVEVSVRDTGPGIPPEDLPRLFERFYRVDKARSRQLGGTGLGLAIVKHLARAQGGAVRVDSELGRGSTFTLTLPVDDLGLAETADIQEQLTYS